MHTKINTRDYLPNKLVECALKVAMTTNIQIFDPFLLNEGSHQCCQVKIQETKKSE